MLPCYPSNRKVGNCFFQCLFVQLIGSSGKQCLYKRKQIPPTLALVTITLVTTFCTSNNSIPRNIVIDMKLTIGLNVMQGTKNVFTQNAFRFFSSPALLLTGLLSRTILKQPLLGKPPTSIQNMVTAQVRTCVVWK